jgi:hypothetical protein
MLCRFAFNAITSSHIFIGGNHELYSTFSRKAYLALLRLVVHLRGQPDFEMDHLWKSAVFDPSDCTRSEGQFLGYKDNPATQTTLQKGFENAVETLWRRRILKKEGTIVTTVADDWWHRFFCDPLEMPDASR